MFDEYDPDEAPQRTPGWFGDYLFGADFLEDDYSELSWP